MGDGTVPDECTGSMGSSDLAAESLAVHHCCFGGLQMADAFLCWVGA